MKAWLLLGMLVGSHSGQSGYSIAAYRTAAECSAALAKYDAKMVAEGARVCAEIDPGTMLVLQSIASTER